METISLASLIEEAVADADIKKLSGNVTSFELLRTEESFIALEQAHSGVFAFLAFHPEADGAVADYVREGTLGSDSGAHILVLYTDDAALRTPGRTLAVDGVDIDSGVHPAYEMARTLFAPKTPPPLPGIIFVDRFTGEGCALYSGLDELSDAAEVRGRLRALFALAENALGPEPNRDKFGKSFGIALQAAQIPYERAGRASLREWLIRGYQNVVQRGSDLVTVIGALL
ncbi:hypothetical protein [Streptomyces sp. NPDC059761]|uniref:hypothetical protein n=1 Tax=Streptomyces sp. NPDC059761 TaxID=3346937 RepID=UPI00366434C0